MTKRSAYLLALSAKTLPALRALAGAYADLLASSSAPPLADLCYSANCGRDAFNHRCAGIAPTAEAMQQALAAFARGGEASAVRYRLAAPAPRVGFFYGASTLMRSMPPDLHALVTLGAPVSQANEARLPALRQAARTSAEADTAQQAVLQFLLDAALRRCAIEPRAVFGEGIGDILAARAAGCVTEAGLWNLLETFLRAAPSGRLPNDPTEQSRRVAQTLRTCLPASVASEAAQICWTSGSTQRLVGQGMRWEEGVPMPAGDAQTTEWQQQMGCDIVVDLGEAVAWARAFGQLQMGVSSHVPSLVDNDGAWAWLLACLADLYVCGCNIRWNTVHAEGGTRVPLPNYVFQRKAFWSRELPSPSLPHTPPPAVSKEPTSAQAVASSLSAVPEALRRTKVAGLVHQALRDVLPHEIEVTPTQPLMELGLTSLSAVQFASALSDQVGYKLPATLAFLCPTVEAVIAHILAAVSPQAPVATPRRAHTIAQPSDAIAIIGAACRFPGDASTPEAFWELLVNGTDMVTEVPPERWDIDAFFDPDPGAPGKMYTRWGAFLRDVDKFDAQFFNISPREAIAMDPQHRILLQLVWNALENAGYTAQQLAQSSTGVFVGATESDYASLAQQIDYTRSDALSPFGTIFSALAGRVSYLLGLRGPSMSVDTACSTSLVAVHLACESLRSGACTLAVAGAVNLMLAPETTVVLSKAHMMGAGGRCRTFDVGADGYVRGEGAGVVILKRLSDALAEGDVIHAIVRGTAVNHNGRSSSFTAPSAAAQAELYQRALRGADVEAIDVDLLETHGTGTTLGDANELQSLHTAYCAPQARHKNLWITSVKTNTGHLESAAGMAGLFKVMLALRNREVPPHLHLYESNRYVDLGTTQMEIPTERVPWLREGQARIAGLSSFGFTGTNAHLILQEAPAAADKPSPAERACHVLTLSATAADNLQAQARRYVKFWGTRGKDIDVANLCYTTNVKRTHFTHRLVVLGPTTDDIMQSLQDYCDGKPSRVVVGQAKERSSVRMAFVFSGQGSQYPGMARSLYRTCPTFRQGIDACAKILAEKLDMPLVNLLTDEGDKINDTQYAQPAIFAVEYALLLLWQAWGITPSIVVGHSVGEYVAAVAAGILSLQDALTLIAKRGALMQKCTPGAMLAVTAAASVVDKTLEQFEGLSIAAYNGPSALVVAGARDQLEKLRAHLQESDIKAKFLTVSHAFHSAFMEPALNELEAAAKTVTFEPALVPLVRNLDGHVLEPGETLSASYLRQHLRAPVQFAQSVKRLDDCDVILEIGASASLLSLVQDSLSERERVFAGSLRRDGNDWRNLLESLSKLHLSGIRVAWKALYEGGERMIPLPLYAFKETSYWMQGASAFRRNVPMQSTATAQVDNQAWGERLSLLQGEEAETYLFEHLRHTLGVALKIDPSTLPLDQPLSDLAIESIVALEIRDSLKRAKIEIPLTTIVAGPSIRALASLILSRSSHASGDTPPARGAWVVGGPARKEASVRLICFPYAGGSPALFRDWAAKLPAHISVQSVQLPGHGSRIGEPCITSMDALVQAMAPELSMLLDERPFAFFGFSLGCYQMLELAYQLRENTGKEPSHLFICGASPPHNERSHGAAINAPNLSEPLRRALRSGTPYYALEENLFLELLSALRLNVVNLDAEARQALMPALRADFEMESTYAAKPRKKLRASLTIMGGDADQVAPPDELSGWRAYTDSNDVNVLMRPGGHEFMLLHAEEWPSIVGKRLS